jgi:CrcB protein
MPQASVAIAVLIGGAVGSLARLLLGAAIQQRFGLGFPVGTLVINVTGSMLLGFLMRFALDTTAITPVMRALLTTGFCGGYTTFSTFSYETVDLMREGFYARAGVYVVSSVTLGLVATFAGFTVAHGILALARGR